MPNSKLYTEEQVREAYIAGTNFIKMNPNDYIILLKPIELPTDEEIYNKCTDWIFIENPTKWSVNDDTAGDNMNSFANGAKWMRDKIGHTK